MKVVGIRKAQFLKPDARSLNGDIGAFAHRLKKAKASDRAQRWDWPDCLLYYATLVERSEVLATGKAAVKQFLKTTYTIDEVLYEQRGFERRVFG